METARTGAHNLVNSKVRLRGLVTKDCIYFLKSRHRIADIPEIMISPISSSYATYASQALQPAARQPQPQSPALPQDSVTLKSAGDVDHDGDSK